MNAEQYYKKCNKCIGFGYYADHDPHAPHINGDCDGNCPIQCPCEDCHASGFVKVNLDDIFKARVNTITDKEIKTKIMQDPNLSPFFGSSFRVVKWFKNKLLNQ